jgi:curved DNA-binding protein CbpA
MTFVDYYKVLGIDKTATAKDIKTSYRKLARKFHPDLNPNDKDAKKNFQQINEANEVLSDPEKRKNTISMEVIGNMPKNLKNNNKIGNNHPTPGARGIRGPRGRVIFPISLNRCLEGLQGLAGEGK